MLMYCSTVKDKISTSSSFNILTSKQVMASETIDVILPTTESTLKEIKSVQKKGAS